jgi:hypothetical protein
LLIRFDLERSSGPGLGGKTAGLLQLAFVAFDTAGAHTKTPGNRVDRGSFLTKGINNALSKIYRVGLHEPQYHVDQCQRQTLYL